VRVEDIKDPTAAVRSTLEYIEELKSKRRHHIRQSQDHQLRAEVLDEATMRLELEIEKGQPK
jgi:hypothetical protein